MDRKTQSKHVRSVQFMCPNSPYALRRLLIYLVQDWYKRAGGFPCNPLTDFSLGDYRPDSCNASVPGAIIIIVNV